MINIQEYAKKVETFLDLWREEMITDVELVDSVTRLSHDVTIIEGNHQVFPESVIKPRTPQDS